MIITFLPLQETHFPLLFKWLESPHLKIWWDQDVRWTLELVKQKYGSYVQGYWVSQGTRKPIRAYIIYVDDAPVGYVQLYNANDFPREDNTSLAELPASFAALDFFIGEGDHAGKGLGARIMKQFLKDYVDPYYDTCFVDPDTANIKAIRTYEKAGFKTIEPTQEGTITWMVREKTAMRSLTFTTRPHPAWDKKIEEGLYKECEALTGLGKSFKPLTIYAKRDGVFMGGITIEQHGGILWIDSLWVEPNFRKRGVGQELMQQAFLYAAKGNAPEVQLNTFFPTAHDFFLAQGFEDVATIPNWKYGLECYLMRRTL